MLIIKQFIFNIKNQAMIALIIIAIILANNSNNRKFEETNRFDYYRILNLESISSLFLSEDEELLNLIRDNTDNKLNFTSEDKELLSNISKELNLAKKNYKNWNEIKYSKLSDNQYGIEFVQHLINTNNYLIEYANKSNPNMEIFKIFYRNKDQLIVENKRLEKIVSTGKTPSINQYTESSINNIKHLLNSDYMLLIVFAIGAMISDFHLKKLKEGSYKILFLSDKSKKITIYREYFTYFFICVIIFIFILFINSFYLSTIYGFDNGMEFAAIRDNYYNILTRDFKSIPVSNYYVIFLQLVMLIIVLFSITSMLTMFSVITNNITLGITFLIISITSSFLCNFFNIWGIFTGINPSQYIYVYTMLRNDLYYGYTLGIIVNLTLGIISLLIVGKLIEEKDFIEIID